MNNEKRSEIIKSLAMGMTAVEIAALEGVSIYDVEKISHDNYNEIVKQKAFLKLKGWD